MELVCKWCGEVKDVSALVLRDKKIPPTQPNVRCCKMCNSAKNKHRYTDPTIRAKQLKANSAWRQENADKMAEYTKRFYEKRPNQQRARTRVGSLIRSGVWQRQPCCVCGSDVQVEAHHDSYAPPHWETVRWLCKEHHEKWHQLLDPVKAAIITEPLNEVAAMRQESGDILKQMAELRQRHQKLVFEADAMELRTWNKVVEEAQPLFRNLR